jgi:hypothetical protein
MFPASGRQDRKYVLFSPLFLENPADNQVWISVQASVFVVIPCVVIPCIVIPCGFFFAVRFVDLLFRAVPDR